MTNTVKITKIVNLPTFDQIKQNTSFKEKHIPGVIETLKWLGAGAPHDDFNGFDTPVNFNMRVYISPNYLDRRTNECGTSCCMAGAISLFTKHKVPKSEKDGEVLDKRFDIEDHDDLHDLFYDYGGNDPHKAFVTLYNYCMTGEVDWDNEDLKTNV